MRQQGEHVAEGNVSQAELARKDLHAQDDTSSPLKQKRQSASPEENVSAIIHDNAIIMKQNPYDAQLIAIPTTGQHVSDTTIQHNNVSKRSTAV